MSPLGVQGRFFQKSKKNGTCRKKHEKRWQKTEPSENEKTRKNFLIRIRFHAEHNQNPAILEFLDEVEKFTRWIYQENYRSIKLERVPKEVQDRLAPQVSRSLLRSFAKVNRKKIQPAPWVQIRGKWISIDLDHHTMSFDPYRRGLEPLVFPMPDIGDCEPENILWVKIGVKDVEYVFGKEPEIVLSTDVGDDDEE